MSTLTLDDIRMSIVDSVENGETREALELLSEARFKIFDALVEMPGFAFLGIGRPESSGCYCKVNSDRRKLSAFWQTASTMSSSTERPALSRSSAALWIR